MNFVEPLTGGALIGLAAALLLLTNGRIMGISGITGATVGLLLYKKNNPKFVSEISWRVCFLFGLFAAGIVILQSTTWLTQTELPFNHPVVWIAAGLLVGVGTRMGWGCTSGHGVCGLGRLSGRSLIGTVTFIGFGMVTVLLAKIFLQNWIAG